MEIGKVVISDGRSSFPDEAELEFQARVKLI